MDLREELPGDREPVRNIHRQAFGGDHGVVVARLVDALRETIAPAGGLPLRIPDRAFQAIKLPGYEPRMTGTLIYPEPFWQHDSVGRRDPSA